MKTLSSSKEIAEYFDPNSSLFENIFAYLADNKDRNKKFTPKFEEWKNLFEHIYEVENFSELFLK